MKFQSIRSRLLLLTAIIVILALLSSFLVATRAFSLTLRETTYTELANNATYLKTLVDISDTPWIENHFDAYARSISTRITIIDREGNVLFDSDHDIAELDNHLWRQEIQEALQSGVAVSERRSSTQHLPVLYHAERVDDHPTIAVVRLSKTLNQLTGYQQSYEELFIRGIVVLVLLSLFISIFSITMLTKPLQKIKSVANKYARGELEAHVHLKGPRELQDLAKTMQEMAFQLKTKMMELESSRHQLEVMLDSLSEGIILLDASMEILVTNGAARLLMFETQQQTGKPILGVPLTHAISSPEIIGICGKTLLDGKSHETTTAHFEHLFGETALVVGKRKTKILKILSVPVFYATQQSKVQQIVLSINDMTELKRLEQIRKEFVANVSHELKTPITAIAGFSDALINENTPDNASTQRFLQIINRQALNMQRIVEDLLLLSSLEQQNASPMRTWTAVDQIVEEVVEACRYRAEEKNSSFKTFVDNPLGLEILVNGMLIVQALSNLVVNALTYSADHSEVLLEITVEDQQVICKVIDHGSGIPKDALTRIFERFYRVDAARSRSQGGTGLGLSIVKHIVGVHGGTVSVESELGVGSTFTVVLPRSGHDLQNLQDRSDSLYQKNN
ncbi:MAG: ATP-binding protein [Sphaerochaeta sp.]